MIKIHKFNIFESYVDDIEYDQDDIDKTINEIGELSSSSKTSKFGFKNTDLNCEKCGKENPKNNSYNTIVGPKLKHVEFCSAECMEQYHFPKFN